MKYHLTLIQRSQRTYEELKRPERDEFDFLINRSQRTYEELKRTIGAEGRYRD